MLLFSRTTSSNAEPAIARRFSYYNQQLTTTFFPVNSVFPRRAFSARYAIFPNAVKEQLTHHHSSAFRLCHYRCRGFVTVAGLGFTPVTDAATWNALCEVSQHRQDLGADWIRENGQLIIGGNWRTESGITDAEQLEITAAPSVIRLRRQEDRVFKA